MIIHEHHVYESKGVRSLLITPLTHSSAPNFAASKVGSPCLGFLIYNVPAYWYSLLSAIHLLKLNTEREGHGISADD